MAVQHQCARNYGEALRIYKLILSACPDHAATLNNLGLLKFDIGKINESIEFCTKAIKIQPDYAFAYQNLGNSLAAKGDMKEAEQMFRKAISLIPHFPNAIHSLVQIVKYKTADNKDVKHILNLLKDNDDQSESRERLCFALAKIYDDCGLYDDAFEYFWQGNDICNKKISHDHGELSRASDNIMKVFDKEFLSRPFSFASESNQPIFVVGMPRSGTTLVANILSNHSKVAAAGELTGIMEAATSLREQVGNNINYPYAARHLTSDISDRLVKDYEALLQRDVDPKSPYIIDKHPINFRFIGLITKLFPNAKIIHCTRDPLDTALSNYFQCFDLQYSYSFDLKNIADYYRDYLRVMEHWRNALPTKMLEINYEDTVKDTKQVTDTILDFIGLNWEEACLTPHKNPRVVRTSSVWQVRQPIYSNSMKRWKNYEGHLGVLKEVMWEIE